MISTYYKVYILLYLSYMMLKYSLKPRLLMYRSLIHIPLIIFLKYIKTRDCVSAKME